MASMRPIWNAGLFTIPVMRADMRFPLAAASLAIFRTLGMS